MTPRPVSQFAMMVYLLSILMLGGFPVTEEFVLVDEHTQRHLQEYYLCRRLQAGVTEIGGRADNYSIIIKHKR